MGACATYHQTESSNVTNTKNQKCHGGNVSKCPHLQKLKSALYGYESEPDPAINNTLDALNHFLHLMHTHNDDEAFEYIATQMGNCNILKCCIFQRNHRCRNQFDDNKTANIAQIDTLDKIHCYYQHCYDIGNRLLIKEQNEIHQYSCEEKKNGDADECLDKYLTNRQILKTNEILSEKQSIFDKLTVKMNNRNNKKYNQLSEVNQHHNSNNVTTDNMYSFGFEFKYGFEHEELSNHSHPIHIDPKYSSFEEEMTSNVISTISMEQFKNEYNKAQIHFDSDYCKREYRPKILDDYYKTEKCIYITRENLLAVLLYCNYTELQYFFSKTYRLNSGKDHDNFYFWGKNLKICVTKFNADYQYHAKYDSFYHGINQHLVFPQYYQNRYNNRPGVSIHCPLSTSSSYIVAQNFANGDSGLIVEFRNTWHCNASYFSTSWLSDYGNESECLFLQNRGLIEIKNIIDVNFGYQYNLILEALQILNEITWDMDIRSYNYSQVDEHEHINPMMKELIIKIISDGLSSLSGYKPFDSLTSYAKKNNQNSQEAEKMGEDWL